MPSKYKDKVKTERSATLTGTAVDVASKSQGLIDASFCLIFSESETAFTARLDDLDGAASMDDALKIDKVVLKLKGKLQSSRGFIAGNAKGKLDVTVIEDLPVVRNTARTPPRTVMRILKQLGAYTDLAPLTKISSIKTRTMAGYAALRPTDDDVQAKIATLTQQGVMDQLSNILKAPPRVVQGLMTARGDFADILAQMQDAGTLVNVQQERRAWVEQLGQMLDMTEDVSEQKELRIELIRVSAQLAPPTHFPSDTGYQKNFEPVVDASAQLLGIPTNSNR